MWCVRVYVLQIPLPGPEESADEDEEDSIWRDLHDRSLEREEKSSLESFVEDGGCGQS